MVEEKFTLEWETEELCQIAMDGNYMACEEAVELLNEYYVNLIRCKEILSPILELLAKNNLDVEDMYNLVKIGILEYNGVLK